MRTLKLTLAYDGTAYAGWQVQPQQRTLQSTLEGTLRKITGHEAATLASGRTDAGVHALGQVVRARVQTHLAPDVLQRALNAELPDDIAVLGVEEAPAGFHPIRDALRKRYRYFLSDSPVRDVFQRRYAWRFPTPLDDAAMNAAAQALAGTHDFSSFETSGAPRQSSVRTIFEVSVRRGLHPGDARIACDVEADGFLYNMMRAIVGTLVEVGRGAQPVDWPARVLAAADRKQAGQTAPPQGLFLVQVDY